MNSIAMHIADIVGGRATAPGPSTMASGDRGSVRADGVAKDAVQPAAPAAKTAPYDQEELGKAVDKINEKVQQVMREIKFSVDDKSDRVVIKVIDQATKEVIREIPPEDIIDVAEKLEQFRGVLLQEKA